MGGRAGQDHHLDARVRPAGLIPGNVHEGNWRVCCEVTLVGGGIGHRQSGADQATLMHTCALACVCMYVGHGRQSSQHAPHQAASGSYSGPSGRERGLQVMKGSATLPRTVPTYPAH